MATAADGTHPTGMHSCYYHLIISAIHVFLFKVTDHQKLSEYFTPTEHTKEKGSYPIKIALHHGDKLKPSIPVGCVPPACILYVLQWPLPDVAPRGLRSDVQVDHQMLVAGEGLAVTSNR